MATDTLTTITQPAPLFEKGAEKYLELLTAQTGAAGALKPLGATPTTRAECFAPGVAQQSALAQATQQQAATQAGLGTLAFDPTTGATGTGSAYNLDSTYTYTFIAAVYDSSGNGKIEGNFGGTQSFTISSGNTDSNGFGNFEYAVPSGYFSLCTKNLAENG